MMTLPFLRLGSGLSYANNKNDVKLSGGYPLSPWVRQPLHARGMAALLDHGLQFVLRVRRESTGGSPSEASPAIYRILREPVTPCPFA